MVRALTAREMGREAFRSGDKASANPFNPRQRDLRHKWSVGWYEAEVEANHPGDRRYALSPLRRR